MTGIHALINRLAAQEAALHTTHFLAPCAPGLRVRVRVAGLVYAFRPVPRRFAGWGIFQPRDAQTAALVAPASHAQTDAYLKLFAAVRLYLVARLRGRTWLAYPGNEADARQRGLRVAPSAVRLVHEARQFEQIVARYDGALCWFDDVDTRADPRTAERLRAQLRECVPAAQLNVPGLTPEARTAYAHATRRAPEFAGYRRHEAAQARLRSALALGGGTLYDYADHGDYYQVDWRTRDGEPHTSAVAKHDLTVMSAGICLSGQDRDFDLQSLVGVVERQWEY